MKYRYTYTPIITDVMKMLVAFMALCWAVYLVMKAGALYEQAMCPTVDGKTLADLHAPFKGTLP